MGCQTEIARQIVAAKADYCLAVKGNQPTLHQGIVDFFDDHLEDDFARTTVRRYQTNGTGTRPRGDPALLFICPVPEDLPDRSRWAGLKAIGIAISNTQRDGKDCDEVRYYILSKYLAARRFAAAVRGHWGIENRLHWQLDVTFQEDQCRLRQGHADANFSILRRTALSLLKNETDTQSRHQEQTPHRRLERQLPRKSPARRMTYGAIALRRPDPAWCRCD